MNDATLLKRLPVAQYEYVDVTFGSANTDYDIRYTTLKPPDPNAVRYLVVSADRACQVYEDLSGSRRSWVSGLIILRCSAATASVRLLLFVEA